MGAFVDSGGSRRVIYIEMSPVVFHMELESWQRRVGNETIILQ